MFKYSKDGVSVLTVLDTRRALKSGLFPVKIQVVYTRVQKYYATGKEMSRDDWEKLSRSRSRNNVIIRNDIEDSFEKIKEIVREVLKQESFTFDSLNQRIKNKNSSTVTINAAFDEKIRSLLEADSIGSYYIYTNALSSITRFSGDRIFFESITVDWLKKYEKWVISRGNTYTTTSMYIRCLRSIFNEAIRSGAIKSSLYPFGKNKYIIPKGNGRKMALNLAQIEQIFSYQSPNEKIQKYRDLWIFSYLVNGINMTDLLKLKYSNISNGEIHFYRSKTIHVSNDKKLIYAVITPRVQSIIDKWGNKDRSPGNYIFPFLKGNETPLEQKKIIKNFIRTINNKMRIVGDALGIPGISSYTARHSFATILKRGGATISYISESLGHSDLRTTETYLASFEKETRLNNAHLLTNFRKTKQ